MARTVLVPALPILLLGSLVAVVNALVFCPAGTIRSGAYWGVSAAFITASVVTSYLFNRATEKRGPRP